MSVDECISAEELAQLIHRYHGVLTGCFDGRTATPPWDDVDPHQRRLMVATARLVLDDLATKQHQGEAAEALAASIDSIDYASSQESNPTTESEADRAERRRYFAKPGNAEWGC
jgi:hypothetical protein